MNAIRGRAKELFPSVLMTLLSIIQALALEFLWGRLHDSRQLWAMNAEAMLGWLQLVAAMLGILQVWLFYTSVVMRFRWLPKVRDLLLPFGIGVLEFAFVDLTASDHLAWWLTTLAIIYALSAWVGQDIFMRARRDPENQEFFGVVGPATASDLVPLIAILGVFLGLAAAVAVRPDSLVLAWVAVTFATGSLLHRMEEGRRYWNRSMGN